MAWSWAVATVVVTSLLSAGLGLAFAVWAYRSGRT